jgi:HAD superfamily hydrolase (TIGR01509 family)
VEQVKIVVLDVDGTLVDTNYLHTEAWARALEEVGRRVPRVEVHRQIGKGADKLISEFVGDEAADKVDRRHSEIYGEMQHYGYPLPGSGELARSLDDRGYGVWLVTSAKPEELDRHLDALGISESISGVVSSGDAAEAKPAPDVFELALKRAGVEAEEAITAGDSVWDIQAAARTGIESVAVLSGGAFSRRELEDAGARGVYRDCAELLETGFPENVRRGTG